MDIPPGYPGSRLAHRTAEAYSGRHGGPTEDQKHVSTLAPAAQRSNSLNLRKHVAHINPGFHNETNVFALLVKKQYEWTVLERNE